MNGMTPMIPQDGEIVLTCEQLNCHGYMQSSDYVNRRLQGCDILCLTETWLKPSELPAIQENVKHYSATLAKECLIFAKSGMENVDPSYSGRPYGGLCVIVKKNHRYTARLIESPSDRTIAVGLYDVDGKLIQMVICVYMPFFNGSAEKLEEFIDTCDVIQTLIDKYGSCAPVMVAGDFNTQLPQSSSLNTKWYKSKGFNKYSSVLYDLISGNNMLAVDLCFKQSPNYTYFNHANQHFTWIDHILCFKRDFSKVISCDIISEDDENVSDHLPMSVKFSLPVISSMPDTNLPSNCDDFTPPKWTNHTSNEAYRQKLSEILDHLGKLKQKDNDIQACIDERLSAINNAIHDAAKMARCTYVQRNKTKPFWCPELSTLRD